MTSPNHQSPFTPAEPTRDPGPLRVCAPVGAGDIATALGYLEAAAIRLENAIRRGETLTEHERRACVRRLTSINNLTKELDGLVQGCSAWAAGVQDGHQQSE